MKRIWYCRHAALVVFILGETELEARASVFAIWNADPDEVRDVTDAVTVLLGPLIALLRERVPARDGSGLLFRFKDPGQALRRWLGDEDAEETICPRCEQATAVAYSRAYVALQEQLQAAVTRITTLEADLEARPTA